MGVFRTKKLAILGPLVPYSLLTLHVIYHHKFKENAPLPQSYWPDGTKESVKKSIIANRKPLIDDMKLAMTGRDIRKVMEKRMTQNVVWEDPIQRMTNQDELFSLADLARYYKSVTFEHYNEIHSEHEVLLDWAVIITMKLPEVAIKIPMRSHVMLEPPKEGAEKIYKVVEDWGGNPPMTGENSSPSILGTVQSMLRRFNGALIHKGSVMGIL